MLSAELLIPEDFVRNVHLATLAICAWFVISADLTAAKSSFHPLSDHDFKRLHRNHKFLAWGLIVFWLSGAYLIWLGTAFDPSQFSPKLMAKITVVTVLTLNAVIIGRLVLPYIERNRTVTFGELPIEVRLRLALCASVSSASWISAFCLGAMPHLKTADPAELVGFLAPIYAALGVGAMLFAALSGYRKQKVSPVAS